MLYLHYCLWATGMYSSLFLAVMLLCSMTFFKLIKTLVGGNTASGW